LAAKAPLQVLPWSGLERLLLAAKPPKILVLGDIITGGKCLAAKALERLFLAA